ncbi:MAG: hypothetical protein NVSMB2_21340 [Chloroflexota bacterium]
MLRGVSVDARDETSAQDTLQAMLCAIWLRSRAANEQRLVLLEAGYQDIAHTALSHERALDAAREAHKLAGGLGSFGFSDASDAARALEQFWRAYADRRASDLSSEAMVGLLGRVRHALDQPLPASFDAAAQSVAPVGAEMHGGWPMPNSAECDAALRSVTNPDHRSQGADRVESTRRSVDVVLIEDDATVSEVLARSLGEYGLSVQTFSDGAAALGVLVGAQADVQARVVVLDYDLPGFDGLAVLRRLRDAGVLGSTRVVMLSLTVDREAVARVINAGATGYIAKPFHWKTVLDRVQMCLDGQPPLFVIGPSAARNTPSDGGWSAR